MRPRLAAATASVALLLVTATPALACGGLIGPNGAVNLLKTTTLAGYSDGVERRVIEVGSADVVVAGIGAVAVHPDVQRQGLGRRLIEALVRVLLADVPVSFGYLTTGPADAAFYRAVGLTRIDATVRYKDPDSGAWEVADPLNFVLPAGSPLAAWPPGPIDLRGTPW